MKQTKKDKKQKTEEEQTYNIIGNHVKSRMSMVNNHISNYENILTNFYKNKNLQLNEPLYKYSQALESEMNALDSTVISNEHLVKFCDVPYYRRVIPTNYLNGSILWYKNKTVFVFRTENADPETGRWFTSSMLHVTELNRLFQPIPSKCKTLTLPFEITQNWDITGEKLKYNTEFLSIPKGIHVEDPRVFEHDERLHLIYGDGYNVYLAELDDQYRTVSANLLQINPNYKDHDAMLRPEKNWVPFSYKNDIYVIYSCVNDVHTVYKIENNEVTERFRSFYDFPKEFGHIRGGTPAYLMEDGKHFITFFHGVRVFRENVPYQYGFRIYSCGAYIFKAEPPFEIVWCSPKPLFKGEPFPSEIQRPARNVLVTFPSGAIYSEKQKGWFVSFGYQDYENRIIFIPNHLLGYSYLSQ